STDDGPWLMSSDTASRHASLASIMRSGIWSCADSAPAETVLTKKITPTHASHIAARAMAMLAP
ncbi:MAG: hypothetical protein ACK58T_22610, partial [Phycisphaerae bacterium]